MQAILSQGFFVITAGTPSEDMTACVCPLGKEYPEAASRADSTIVKLGSLTQGRGMRNQSFKNWLATTPIKPVAII